MDTTGVKIRKWDLSDATIIAEFANNKNIADNLRDTFPFPYSLKDANNFIQAALKRDSSAELFAIEYDGIAVGSIGALFKEDIYRYNVEIGFWVAEEYWGRGIATESIKLITNHIFKNYDIVRIYAETFSENMGSQRALIKAGYSHEATISKNIFKNGQLLDSHIYALIRSENKGVK